MASSTGAAPSALIKVNNAAGNLTYLALMFKPHAVGRTALTLCINRKPCLLSSVEPRPLGAARVGDRALVGLTDLGGVFGQEPRLVPRRCGPPRGAAAGEFGVVDQEIHPPGDAIDADPVAVAHQRQRSADRRFRRDIAD